MGGAYEKALEYALVPRFARRGADGRDRAQAVYSDELTEGLLPFTLTLTGGDAAGSVGISTVSCYQSGSGRRTTLTEPYQLRPLVNEDGSEGENTITVTAQSDAGEQCTFKINIPYKLRGDGVVKIETNLEDGEKVKNETRIQLFVTAWSEKKDDGTRIAQMTASDTVVTLDGEARFSSH